MAPGSQFAPTYGDWEKEAHGKLIRLAPGLDVPFHSHTNSYHGVMVSGRMTNIYKDGTSTLMGSGDYWEMPAAIPHAHKCISEEPCLLYTHMPGAWDYIAVEGN
jgi:quercetin dioxygenase-like cupin family protein